MRYVRQSMLPEIGAAGQANLEARPVRLSGPARAVAWATLYLERAGVRVATDPGGHAEPLSLPPLDPARPELAAAAQAIAGAWAAIELIKRRVDAGASATLDVRLTGPNRDPS